MNLSSFEGTFKAQKSINNTADGKFGKFIYRQRQKTSLATRNPPRRSNVEGFAGRLEKKFMFRVETNVGTLKNVVKFILKPRMWGFKK